MTDNALLKKLIDRKSLLRMGGVRSFERGEDYFTGGQVSSFAAHEGTITARVQGTRSYRVKLWARDGSLEYSCTCPVGTDGEFCKHCVAVGLLYLEQESPLDSRAKKRVKPSVTMDDVRSLLLASEKDALVEMLMEQAMEDPRLRQRLLMKAAKRTPMGLDLDTYRQAFDDAVNTGRYVEYGEMVDYAQGIEDTVDSIEELLAEGHAAEVIELVEYGLAVAENALGYVDDSNGHVGGILERLQDLHLKACRKATPDPEELARRIFALEMSSSGDTFYKALEKYADVLGEKGLAVYRSLAEAEWARVPVLGPRDEDPEMYGRRSRITRIMETLALKSGDIESIVEVRKRDLSSPYAYLAIAETYKKARKYDPALDWAERGIKAFPERTDSRLREFLAEEYHRRKRHEDAMSIVWAGFTEAVGLGEYKNLKLHAERIGQWQPWREKALAHIRKKIANAKREERGNRWSWVGRTDHTDLVEIFLWEGDVEAAWSEAVQGGCADALWLKLAGLREKNHPEDSLPIYMKRIEPTLAQKNNQAYDAAFDLLRKVRRLMERLERKEEFGRYMESIRAAHKPKRNFMKLLEREKWS